MPKIITSHKDLTINWVAKRNRYVLRATPVGGGEPAFKTKPEAQARAKELFELWQRGPDLASGSRQKTGKRWTIDDAIKEFIEVGKVRVEDTEDRYGAHHFRQQKDHLRRMANLKVDGVRFGNYTLSNVSVALIIGSFWPKMKSTFSLKSAARHYITLQSMLNLCVAHEQLPSNPARDARAKTLRPRVILPNIRELQKESFRNSIAKVAPENIQKILNAIPTMPEKLTVMFACQTGLRASEQVMIRIYDPKRPELGGIDFANNSVWVEQALKRGETPKENYVGEPKSKSGIRRVPISSELSDQLKAMQDNFPARMKTEGWLFPTTHGTRPCADNWRNRILHAACKKAGLPREEWPTWHDLRHVYATSLMTANPNPVLCTERMGHADIQTSLLYKHAIIDAESDARETAEIANVYGLTLEDDTAKPAKDNVVKFKKAG